MKAWLQRRILDPVRNALTGGTSPRAVALALAVGCCVSIFPLLGVTTALCAYAAFRLRLNLVIVQVANWIAAPLQVVLLLPFYRYGGLLLGADASALTIDGLRERFAADFLAACLGLWRPVVGGVALWIAIALPVGWLLFVALHALFRRWRPAPAGVAT